jgi:hypothetical protein
MPNGYSFLTTYIHSLELTPVVDDYRFVGGRIWGWEEWTVSLNAGLPSALSPSTRHVQSPPWMITRGGRRGTDLIYYRVGDAEFGRNVWSLKPWEDINIFEKYPRYRISLEASVVPMRLASVSGFDTIHDQPNANNRIFSLD